MDRKAYVATILLATLGAMVLVSLFSTVRFSLQAFEFDLSVEVFDHGQTAVEIPPVGVIRAKTHNTPLKLTFTLRNIDMDLLRELFQEPSEQQILAEQVMPRLRWVARWFILRTLLLAGVGGALGVIMFRGKRGYPHPITGALWGLTLGVALFFSTYLTYDSNRFRNPEYEGVLKMAPWVVGMVEEAATRVHTLGQQLRLIANNIYVLYESLDNLQAVTVPEGGLKVLHVSDIHNNPAAYDFVDQITRSFGVDMVIDTGDLSDFGTPIEARLANRLSSLVVPYVFVAGNHDSPEIIKALRRIRNVVILDGKGIQSVRGIKMIGIGDPSSKTSEIVPPPGETIELYVAKIEALLTAVQETPDLLAVHNPAIGRPFAGRVPVILHGHDHRLQISEKNGSVIISAGTTGAAGIRGLQTANEVPYSLVLLYFLPMGNKWYLSASDMIRVANLRSGFVLERRVFPLPAEGQENSVLPRI